AAGGVDAVDVAAGAVDAAAGGGPMPAAREELSPPVSAPGCDHASTYILRSPSVTVPSFSPAPSTIDVSMPYAFADSVSSALSPRNISMYALARCCAASSRSILPKTVGCGALMMTSLSSISGCSAANTHATTPPQSWATSVKVDPPVDFSSSAASARRSYTRFGIWYADSSVGFDDRL